MLQARGWKVERQASPKDSMGWLWKLQQHSRGQRRQKEKGAQRMRYPALEEQVGQLHWLPSALLAMQKAEHEEDEEVREAAPVWELPVQQQQ